ncbi:protein DETOXIFICATION 7 isoform X3 [Arabidopsis lyrata subsp. lyrata]|uniref:protein DETOXIFICATION 7 isoform X3 n=1 Tax=Arabidopsis lyrata subsp. lyrata TaxID=81972 RepID=UPI000A29D060|nr:protein DETOXIFICATION 7 isoform X3 [Arabidopsis lyrata subsp. lyrata]|eukprot:XP_020890001.1 protein DETOXIFICATION 7 isoform X3 [Arabidopsis lyrata subsp. lyrata]
MMEKDFSLVRNEEEEDNRNGASYLSVEMMKKVSSMAAPMVAVSVSQFLLQVISMVMAGHLDELSLSAVAIATSLTNVTGFSLIVGFAVSLVWIFMDKLLELFHQDPLISQLACRYSIWLIPALFGFALLQPMTCYFQSQGLILPLFVSSLGAICFHIPFCWLLVYKLRFGIVGAALSIGFSYWLNVFLLRIFMSNSALHREMKNLGLQELISSMKQFIALAIPSAMMICLEWWSFEILLLMSGLLPNSKLETSVISICLTTSALHFVLVNAIGASASTYVSNELGAGNHRAARAAVSSAIFLGGVDATIASITLYSYRNSWGYIFSNEKEVAHYVTQITPILCLFIFVNSFLAVLSGKTIILCYMKPKKSIFNSRILSLLRGCQRNRLATYRRLCKFRIILSCRNPVRLDLVFCHEVERKRTLDWYTHSLHYPTKCFYPCHLLHQLGTRGNESQRQSIRDDTTSQRQPKDTNYIGRGYTSFT